MLFRSPGYEREVEFLMPSAIRLGLPIGKSGAQLAFWVVPVSNTECLTFHAWFMPRAAGVSDTEFDAAVTRLKGFIYEMDASDPVYSSSKVSAQDKFACASQGVVTDRWLEHLGKTDAGVILMRTLFREGMADVEAGRPSSRGRLTAESQSGMLSFDNVF